MEATDHHGMACTVPETEDQGNIQRDTPGESNRNWRNSSRAKAIVPQGGFVTVKSSNTRPSSLPMLNLKK